MKRVLHLSSGNLYGGIETLLVTLAAERNLCPEMKPEYALCFEGRLSSELRETGVEVDIVGKVRFSRPWTVWWARRWLRQRLIDNPPDAVIAHACWPHSVFAPAVRGTRIPLLFWAHDVANMGHWLDRKAARTLPDRLIVNSEFTSGTLHQLFPKVPSAVVYYPVRARAGDATRRAALRSEFQTGADDIVVLLASRLEAWKGHPLALESLGRLKDNPRWTCWIAGGAQRPHEEEYQTCLKAQAEAAGIAHRLRWLGERKDVPDLMAAADVFCQSNARPEPFGIVFIEALHAGRPVVSVRHGGAAEIIDSTCGLLAEPGRADQLAELLGRVIDSPELRHRLSEGGPHRARQLCEATEQLGRLYEQIGTVCRKSFEKST